MQNNVNTNISWYEGHNFKKFGQKIKIFQIVCTKYMASSEAMTSSTHSFAYSYGLVKKCFLKICGTSKCHNFIIFQPIFIRFSLFCSENFTLSSEIKLDQLRTSPLTRDSYTVVRRKLRGMWPEKPLKSFYHPVLQGEHRSPHVPWCFVWVADHISSLTRGLYSVRNVWAIWSQTS